MGFVFVLGETNSPNQTLSKLSQLIQIPRISLSTGFLEENYSVTPTQNRLYPQMKNYNQMDFVYAQ